MGRPNTQFSLRNKTSPSTCQSVRSTFTVHWNIWHHICKGHWTMACVGKYWGNSMCIRRMEWRWSYLPRGKIHARFNLETFTGSRRADCKLRGSISSGVILFNGAKVMSVCRLQASTALSIAVKQYFMLRMVWWSKQFSPTVCASDWARMIWRKQTELPNRGCTLIYHQRWPWFSAPAKQKSSMCRKVLRAYQNESRRFSYKQMEWWTGDIYGTFDWTTFDWPFYGK